jgi:xanthine/CO dehydrogenase XdhC/CoxF family maturation factor
VLRRGDFAWLGLIGSDTKRRRFEGQLRARGIPATRLDRLVCPIGIRGIGGKEPAVIAASVAAQLLIASEARAAVRAEPALEGAA